MWGYRLVIPEPLRELILKQLHSSHLGIVKTKSVARSYVRWPNIDSDIKARCRHCETCAQEAQAPPRATPQSWPYIPEPWSRLHVDFLVPYQGKTYFMLVDSSTKWIEIQKMNKTNAGSVIKVLRSTFARFGLPIEVVSDQGPPFTSKEYGEFLTMNGIKMTFSPTYHPASNGAAENAVKLCKRAIKKTVKDSVDVDVALQTYLLAYRNNIQSTIGETPAMLLQSGPLRPRLDLLRGPCTLRGLCTTQRPHSMLQKTWTRNYATRRKWEKGTVVTQEGSRRFIISNDSGQLKSRHVDQIKRRSRRTSMRSPGSPIEPNKEDVVVQQSPELTVREDARESVVIKTQRPYARRWRECLVVAVCSPHGCLHEDYGYLHKCNRSLPSGILP